MRKSRVKDKYIDKIITIQDLLRTSAEIYEDMVAVKIKNKNIINVITYRQLWNDVCNVSVIFQDKNWRGKNIALLGTLDYDWLVVFYAIICSGNVAVPIDYKSDDVSSKLEMINLEAIYFDSSVKNKNEYLKIIQNKLVFGNDPVVSDINIKNSLNSKNGTIPYGLKEDDEALIIFTSGTTGKSKGVVLTHNNVISNTKCSVYFFEDEVREGANIMPILPPTHMFEITTGLLTPLYYGVSFCFGQSIKYLSQDIKIFKPDVLILVPMIVENLYEKVINKIEQKEKLMFTNKIIKISNFLRYIGIDFRKYLFKSVREAFGGELKIIICGGAPLNPKVIRGFDNFGIDVREGYGITECSPVISCNRKKECKVGSVGVKGPDEFCQVNIIDGEICVKGRIVFKGYYKDKHATEKVLQDGWFHTGDLGYIDKEGFIFITGRLKNLIILADGNNVSPEEIEKHFHNCQLIKSIFVTTKEYDGQVLITALVHPNNENDEVIGDDNLEAEIIKLVKGVNVKLPAYKRIQRIEFSRFDFDKTLLGKIQRFKY